MRVLCAGGSIKGSIKHWIIAVSIHLLSILHQHYWVTVSLWIQIDWSTEALEGSTIWFLKLTKECLIISSLHWTKIWNRQGWWNGSEECILHIPKRNKKASSNIVICNCSFNHQKKSVVAKNKIHPLAILKDTNERTEVASTLSFSLLLQPASFCSPPLCCYLLSPHPSWHNWRILPARSSNCLCKGRPVGHQNDAHWVFYGRQPLEMSSAPTVWRTALLMIQRKYRLGAEGTVVLANWIQINLSVM